MAFGKPSFLGALCNGKWEEMGGNYEEMVTQKCLGESLAVSFFCWDSTEAR